MGILRENLGSEFNLLPVEDRLDDDYQAELLTDLTGGHAVDARNAAPSSAEDLPPVLLSKLAAVRSESPSSQSSTSNESAFKWVSVDLELALDNVGLELVVEGPTPRLTFSLARIEFPKSKVIFQGFTFGTLADAGMSVHIVSDEIWAHDCRPELTGRTNYFRDILAPSTTDAASGPSATTPQLEVRYTADPATAHLDVLFHRARLVIAPDWLKAVKEFLASTNSIEFGQAPTKQVSPAATAVLSPSPSAIDVNSSRTSSPTLLSSGSPPRRNKPVARDEASPLPTRKISVKFCMHHAEFLAVQNTSSKYSHGVVLKFNADFKYSSAPGYVDFSDENVRDRRLLGSSSDVAASQLYEFQIHVRDICYTLR